MLRGRCRLYGLQLVHLFGALSADRRMAAGDVWLILRENDDARDDAHAARAHCHCGTLARWAEPDEEARLCAGAKLTGADGASRPVLLAAGAGVGWFAYQRSQETIPY